MIGRVWDFRFYEASAQILPVLYLAILVEYRLLHEHWDERSPLVRAIMATAALWLAVVFALGEFQALDVVSAGEVPTGSEPLLILAAYLLAFGTLVWPLEQRSFDAARSGLGLVRRWLVFLAGMVAFVLVIGLVRVLLWITG